jgi:hypothetical protein
VFEVPQRWLPLAAGPWRRSWNATICAHRRGRGAQDGVAQQDPLVEREPLFHLHDEPAAGAPLPGGHPVTSLYGEQGVVVRGWLRRFHPELVAALHLLEGLVRAPHHLADVGCAAGGGALHHLGRILAERLARAAGTSEEEEPEG